MDGFWRLETGNQIEVNQFLDRVEAVLDISKGRRSWAGGRGEGIAEPRGKLVWVQALSNPVGYSLVKSPKLVDINKKQENKLEISQPASCLKTWGKNPTDVNLNDIESVGVLLVFGRVCL